MATKTCMLCFSKQLGEIWQVSLGSGLYKVGPNGSFRVKGCRPLLCGISKDYFKEVLLFCLLTLAEAKTQGEEIEV